MEVMDAVGKEFCHKFGSTDGEVRDDVLLKRLDYMNRPLQKIILIDDDPEASQLFPRNTLLIKPFNNIYDKTDKSLLELIPLLQALIHENVDDVRDIFDDVRRLINHVTELVMHTIPLVVYYLIILL